MVNTKLKLSDHESKVFLCKKGKELRLSVIQKIGGKRTFEVIFVKSSSEEEFIEKIKESLHLKKIKPFQKIQRFSRFSKTQNLILSHDQEMEKVDEMICEKVKNILYHHTQALSA